MSIMTAVLRRLVPHSIRTAVLDLESDLARALHQEWQPVAQRAVDMSINSTRHVVSVNQTTRTPSTTPRSRGLEQLQQQWLANLAKYETTTTTFIRSPRPPQASMAVSSLAKQEQVALSV
uniref:Uncharacterized protein n=1 Tax=Entomoneis paludosa TaxID=265537 RepID=A0A7S3DLZ1_9STRA